MSAYELAKMACFGLMFVLGLIMVIIPKQCTRKDMHEDSNQVAKTRTSGIVIMICGALLIVLNLFM